MILKEQNNHLRKLGFILTKELFIRSKTKTVVVISPIELEVYPENSTNPKKIGFYVKGKIHKIAFDIQEKNEKTIIVIKKLPLFLRPKCIIIAIPNTAEFALRRKIK